MTKTEFLLIITIQYQSDRWWELWKIWVLLYSMMKKSISVWLYFCVSISGAESPKVPVPLGMESGAIFDSQITASSVFNDRHAAPNVRLHFQGSKNPVRYAGWVPGVKNTNQWLQVDLQQTTRVIGIATQGRHDWDQWVTKYKLQYGDDGLTFRIYKRNVDTSDTVSKRKTFWTWCFFPSCCRVGQRKIIIPQER